ncbi:type II toxin-antitoxin system prevent-host-death family antitoxin [Mesorhizobium sp. PAMC28654]|uniref:type II toxin-antitoxin system prevent-host-death family antitoxin n=1 Tax=Mesorhizobium sp. PAMC28654 TaxID=2880934 RepID=UPI001D09DA0C|nr:type II toxin-antitoxin system prevent-host-death family antitoxin [Mesorhizobium sp. PAMC28654]UDL87706.1 type II toxin-antitoxin system prevent-host-death family antitoxin [Mesorhizobium sp. PAMC28654]
MKWDIQSAKSNLSKLVGQSREKGPQTISVRGMPVAVVLAVEDSERFVAEKPSLAEYRLSGPEWDDDLVEEVNRRSNTMIRAVDL